MVYNCWELYFALRTYILPLSLKTDCPCILSYNYEKIEKVAINDRIELNSFWQKKTYPVYRVYFETDRTQKKLDKATSSHFF